jgi:hypothetical protein
MLAVLPPRSVCTLAAICALSLGACGGRHLGGVGQVAESETAAGKGAAGKAGSTGSKAGSGGSSGRAGASGRAGTGGRAGAGGKVAAGAGGKAAAGEGGRVTAGASGSKPAAGGGDPGQASAAGQVRAAGETTAGAGGEAGQKAGPAGDGSEVGGTGGTAPNESFGMATATLVGLLLDGSEAVGGEEAGTVSTENATATFTQTASGVTLQVELTGCDVGQSYPIDIHAGRSCKDVTTQGDHWDGVRGIEIPELVCGADRTVSLNHTRTNSDPATAWTVRDGRATDVVGHVLIIHGPYNDRTLRASCGAIE